MDDIIKRRNYAKKVLYGNNPDDAKDVDKLAGLLTNVTYHHQTVLTDFLNPGQRDTLKMLAADTLIIQEYGGYPEAEKKRVYISEDGKNLRFRDYSISACKIDYSYKYNQLSHGEILGSLANSGIESDTFGDIITDGQGKWQFFVKSELLNHFQNEVRQIGRTQVRIRPILNREVLIPEDNAIELSVISSALRLDAVLSGVSNKSRRQIKEAIADNLVKLNWHVTKDSNIIVKENDILSLRHFGRCQILDLRTTKKGKFKVVLKLWQTKKNKQKKH